MINIVDRFITCHNLYFSCVLYNCVCFFSLMHVECRLFFFSITNLIVRPPPLPTSIPPPVDDHTPTLKTTNKNGTYTKGDSTELLESTVKLLRLNEKPEFRSGAGKLISMMLEARVPTDNASTPTTPILTSTLKIKKPLPNKTNDCVDTSLPVIPIPPPLVPAKSAISLNQNMAHQSPSFKSLVQKSSQVPQPQLIVVSSFEQQPLQSSVQNTVCHPLPSDTLLTATRETNPESSSPTESLPAAVVLRQRKGANKSASHARDRRSFIEKDGVQQVLDTLSGSDRNRMVGGSTVDTLPAGSISDDGLWNGTTPVCCVCNIKIQR